MIKCNNCRKEIKVYQSRLKIHKDHFCNKRCHGRWLSKNNVGKNNPNYKGKIKVKCNNCGKHIFIFPFELSYCKHHFCKNNRKCYGKWRSKIFVGKINTAYIHGMGESNFYSKEFCKIRDKIRKRDRYKCQYCGLSQKRNLKNWKKKLSIHHIDYNKLNFNPMFLISLCDRCHGKTGHNRDFWYALFSFILKHYYKGGN